MSEPLQDAGQAVEALAAGVHAREDGVEFVGDAFLFSGGWERKLRIEQVVFRDSLVTH